MFTEQIMFYGVMQATAITRSTGKSWRSRFLHRLQFTGITALAKNTGFVAVTQ